jgi:hypothetical protein
MVRTYNVTFIGDFFSTQTTVELDITDDNEDNESRAIATACDLLADYYGWDILSVSTVDVEVEELV